MLYLVKELAGFLIIYYVIISGVYLPLTLATDWNPKLIIFGGAIFAFIIDTAMTLFFHVTDTKSNPEGKN